MDGDSASGIWLDPGHIPLEETLLQRIMGLSNSLEDTQASSGLAFIKRGAVSDIKRDNLFKKRQIDCIRSSDCNCNMSYHNIFNDAVDRLFEHCNLTVKSYNINISLCCRNPPFPEAFLNLKI